MDAPGRPARSGGLNKPCSVRPCGNNGRMVSGLMQMAGRAVRAIADGERRRKGISARNTGRVRTRFAAFPSQCAESAVNFFRQKYNFRLSLFARIVYNTDITGNFEHGVTDYRREVYYEQSEPDRNPAGVRHKRI